MAARDHWESEINCPKCGQTGVIGLSQVDYPFMQVVKMSKIMGCHGENSRFGG
jgi:C4-type Zn-finger protein